MKTVFVAEELAVQIIAALRPLLPKIRNKRLRDQMEEAADSILQNVCEGNYREGADKPYHFTVALGSADEVRACLRGSIAKQNLSADECAAALALIDRQKAVTYRLIHPRVYAPVARTSQ